MYVDIVVLAAGELDDVGGAVVVVKDAAAVEVPKKVDTAEKLKPLEGMGAKTEVDGVTVWIGVVIVCGRTVIVVNREAMSGVGDELC